LLLKNNKILKLSLFINLVKYRLSLAVAFSAATGYFLNRNETAPGLFFLFSGTFLLAAGSSVLNQVTEHEQDAIMPRTRNRPVAAKKITVRSAKIISFLLLFSGGSLLLLNGLIPFALGCLGVIMYNLIYTPMKKITVLAIIPGAFVGAIPPLIGYTSAGTADLNNKILFFSTFMFLWQIPHFWLLMITYGKEYQAAGFRTISDYLTEKQIRFLVFFWILISAGALLFFSLLTDMFGKTVSTILAVLNIIFILSFLKSLFASKESPQVKSAFIIFNAYSLLVMILLIADSFLSVF